MRASAPDDTCGALRCPALLTEDDLASLVRLVGWSSLHHAEIKALMNQATSYSKATAAARACNHQLLQEASWRLGVLLYSLPPGQKTARYLACWCSTRDLMPGSDRFRDLLGHNKLQIGFLEVKCMARVDRRDPLGRLGSEDY
jgi:hypothetical protein